MPEAPKAAAILNGALRLRLSDTQLIAQDLRSFMRSEAWNGIDSRNAQNIFLVEFTQTESGITLDNRILVGLFQFRVPRLHEI
jgi:hypothetical protein